MRETEAASRTLARSLASHTLKTIQDVDEIALFIKYGYEIAPDSFNLAQYQARGLIAANTALQVTIVGEDGNVLSSTLNYPGVVNVSDREHFLVHRLHAQVGLFISQPVIGRVSKQWSVQATRRINRPDGTFGGVVVVSENSAYLTEGFYNNTALREHGLIAVTSRRGFTLSRQAGGAPSTTGGPLITAYSDVPTTRNGMVVDPVDHIERIVASRSIDRYDLVVVVGLSVDEALDDYRKMRTAYVTMAFVITAILIGFSSWMMAHIASLLRSKEAMRRLSVTDRLTGVFNRRQSEDMLHHAVLSSNASGRVAAVFIDLDKIKQLNDIHGHQAGDEALVTVAERIRIAVGTRGAIGRLGGDEFLVVVAATDACKVATRTAQGIAGELANAIMVRGLPYVLHASLGVAVPESGDSADDLVRKADEAMYDAKACGRVADTTTWRAFERVSIQDVDAVSDAISREKAENK